PKILSFYLTAIFFFALIFFVQAFKLFPVDISQTRRFVGAEERPHLVILYPFHEQVGNPERVEQVARPKFFLAVVLLEIEEIEDVGVPGFEVYREASFALSSSMINIAGRHVEVAKHRNDAIGCSACALDVRTLSPYVMDAEPDATCRLRNLGALFQRIIDAVDAVFLHSEKEAGRQLRFRCP